MLYQGNRHEPLQPIPWNEAEAYSTIQAIVRDAEQDWDEVTFWPIHLLDRDFPPPVPTYKSLYEGATGVLWGLHTLRLADAAEVSLDPAALMPRVYQSYLAAPDTGDVVPSYFLGDVGIALVYWRLAPNAELANRIYEQVEANITNPTNEALWAAPGTMLAALWMGQWTQEPRWQGLYQRNAEYVWQQWHYNPEWDCYLWTQDLYDSISQMTGPAHGYAGNLYALLRGTDWLAQEQRTQLYERTIQAVAKTAQVEDGLANWYPVVTRDRVLDHMLVQWCHGAPGMVTSLAQTFPAGLSEPLDTLLLQAGELTWQAGPLKKGPGLCHGTAGNGYAFLKLHQRTQDEQWLNRARQFGMHAIEQYRQMRQRYDLGRYSLWTGDMGLALYLLHCIQGKADFPSLDSL